MTKSELEKQLNRTGKWVVGDMRFLVDQIGLFSTKAKAVKEYVANALDTAAESSQENLEVKLILDPQNNSVIITDDGSGVRGEDLVTIPERIADSKKRQLRGVSKRIIGNKGFGMQAFRTIGDSAVIVSRAIGERMYNALEMVVGHDPRYGLNIDPESIPGPEFDHGTRVIVSGVDPKFFRSQLSSLNLRRDLGRIFEPRLIRDRDKVRILVGVYQGEDKEIEFLPVELPSYECCIPIDEINCELTSLDRRFDISPEQGGGFIDAFYEVKLFVDPTSVSYKVRLHNDDVEVSPIVALDGMQHNPWLSPNLTGFVNVNFFELMPSRDSVADKKGTRLHLFKSKIIKPREAVISKKLEEIMSMSKPNQDAAAESDLQRSVLDLINLVYQNSPFYTPFGHNPVGPRPPGTGGGGNGGGGARDRRMPYPINYKPFSEDERLLPVKYDLEAVNVNTAHTRYKIEVSKSADRKRGEAYIAEQLALGIAVADISRWARKRGEDPKEYLNNMIARASELLCLYRIFINAKK